MENCAHSSLGVSWSHDTGRLSGCARDLEGVWHRRGALWVWESWSLRAVTAGSYFPCVGFHLPLCKMRLC